MGKKLLSLFIVLAALSVFPPGAIPNVSPPLVLAAAPPPPFVQWTRTFGGAGVEVGYSVQQTTDGGYIIVGSTMSFGAGSHDIYLVKTDSSGNMAWSKTFGGANEDQGFAVGQTVDGGYIISGYTQSFGAGFRDVYLIKTDASGNIVWSKTLGGVGWDEGSSVQQTADGGYIVSGTSAGEVYLVNTDSAGNVTWSKTFWEADYDYGYGNSVQQIADGGYIVGGYISSLSTRSNDIYLVKTDTSGKMVWSQTWGGTGSDKGYSVLQATDGGYVISGSTESFGAGNSDVYFIKTDASGNMIWSKTFGGTPPDYGRSVQQTPDGGYVIIGSTYSFGAGSYDVYLIKTDASGSMIWTKTLGGASIEHGNSVQQTADGGYIIVGDTNSSGAGSNDIYLIKLGPATANIPGDANDDGVINALDITKIERIVVGLDAPTPGADANLDGNINALDITRAERLIAGLG